MFSIPSTEENKNNLVRSIDQNEKYFCLLNSNTYKDKYSSITWKLSYGQKLLCLYDSKDAFAKLKEFVKEENYCGFLAYDLKNDVEKLSSKNPPFINFPELFFFEIENSFEEKNNQLHSKSSIDIGWIENIPNPILPKKLNIQQAINKEAYIETVNKIKHHIIEGDVYELNYCIPFEISDIELNPVELYFKLNDKSPNPFSGILKIDNLYILSASPERFLCKRGSKLISQPIKGTIKRTTNIELDKDILLSSEKEKAENVMIVDLVRNDLTKSALIGSIKVEELFGIYTFPQLHQMISTVSAELKPDIHFVDAIKNAYPMGSMTGAPKVRAMEIIEKQEVFKRGPYSGAMGQIEANGNFDFNVLIRSIFIDVEAKKLCFNVGSAITINSDPEQEYEECLLKAKAIFETLL
jgi:para-aminobenzoate synthetase component I